MNILLVGSGGREHALAWKLAKSSKVARIFVAPGNGGTASELKCQNVPISATDFNSLVAFAVENGIDLCIPGPEEPLVLGIEAHFRKVGIPCFGPSKEAAVMEGSKDFSKQFMLRHGIPTAKAATFTDYTSAVEYINEVEYRVVIKASGLAAGKGVVIPSDKQEAQSALHDMMVAKVFGDAGNVVLIEEFLEGQEISVLAFCDGYTILPMPAAQDHKRALDGDLGLNTGGMGCYAPAPVATKDVMDQIHREVLLPSMRGMREEGFPFVGVLFLGFMITDRGPRLLEYNVRFGDPEVQTLLPLLEDDCDLVDIIVACVDRRLDCIDLRIKNQYSVTVVLSAQGYPASYPKGDEISISGGGNVFHAGTQKLEDGKLVTAGGRVIAANATGNTLKEAVNAAYEKVREITFSGAHYRRDIAYRALSTSTTTKSLTYKDAGVSVSAGNELVRRIKSMVRSTARPGADAEIGGFGGLFDLSKVSYNDGYLVAATDGIGTKLKVAIEMGVYDTVGIDLVAMNVNDLIVQGAEPLFFLDYFACGKLDPQMASAFVQGVVSGCLQSNCALIGGETAEMPGLYAQGDFDASGTAIGAVKRDQLLPKPMKVGDVLIGLASNGCHSNGFSLVRKLVDGSGLRYDQKAPWTDSTLGHALLSPTKIYVKELLPLVQSSMIKGMSHITGGGLIENVPRMLSSKSLAARIDVSKWSVPPVFKWLQSIGRIEPIELATTFNMGIGMVLVASPDHASSILQHFSETTVQAVVIGSLIESTDTRQCLLENLHEWE